MTSMAQWVRDLKVSVGYYILGTLVCTYFSSWVAMHIAQSYNTLSCLLILELPCVIVTGCESR